ncbi:O-antigen ligase family protein [Priestia sp. FSL R5-0597]|uniref:O-antigen ligase family protein n=1 Tax=Priestia TaxID=2800373 RepID=UPI0012B79FE5|nr:O-antigen ligase family protein [Priestia megaterium]
MNILRKKSASININSLLGINIYLYLMSYVLFFESGEVRIVYDGLLLLLIILGTTYILLQKRVILSPFFIASLVYGIILLVSYLYTPSPVSGKYGLTYYGICLVIIFILTNYIDCRYKIYQLIKLFVWAGVAISLKTFNYYGFGMFTMASNYTGSTRTAFRIGGDIGNSNNIGMYCMFATVFAIYLISEQKVKIKGIYIAACLLCTTVGLLTGSKKAIIILFVGTAILFITKKGNSIGKKVLMVFIAICVLSLIYWAIMKFPFFTTIKLRIEEFLKLFSDESSSSDDYARFYMFEKGMDAFRNHPFIGNGVYSSQYYFGAYSHNNYIEILMNTGIIGFIGFYAIYFMHCLKIINGSIKFSEFRSLVYSCLLLILMLGSGFVYYFSVYFQTMMVLISSIIYIELKRKRNAVKTE